MNGKDVKTYSSKGTITPDHVIRVKPFPLIISPKKSSSLSDFQHIAEKEIKIAKSFASPFNISLLINGKNALVNVKTVKLANAA